MGSDDCWSLFQAGRLLNLNQAETREDEMTEATATKRVGYAGLLAMIFLTSASAAAGPGDGVAGRDPKQAIDAEYTKKILEYTTQPMFASPLVDYLPASKTVPTPKAVLGDVAGAPGILPYSKQVYEYMRMLEKASPRVKVYTI